MKCSSYNIFFETISTKIRLEVLELLKNKPMSVNEIADALKEEQSKVSHNLKSLAGCHILDVKQEGKKRIYSLNKDTIVPLIELVEKHVLNHCKGHCKIKGDKK